MDSGRWRVVLIRFIICGLLAETVAAADDEKDDKDNEFAFNLFTDIAPILALFGEQFAKQFMSESFTWLDHVIFAMVPLGIVAGITSAIRVQGPSIVRAFIGRARENKALVEYELMSSTSHEVGEAFNGQGIVRVMGRPRVVEFVIFPKQYDDAEEFHRHRDQEVPTGDKPDEAENTATSDDSSDEGSWNSYTDSTDSSDSSGSDSDDHVPVGASETRSLSEKHEVCGIHSLESIIKANDPGLMRYGAYRSHGSGLLYFCRETIQSWLVQLISRAEYVRENVISEGFRARKRKPDPETAEAPKAAEEEAKEEDAASTESSDSSIPKPALGAFSLGPPNLQLNLTPDHADDRQHNRRIVELYAVAIVAVLLQTGLIILAAATVYYAPLRRHIRYDSQAYGFPCYAAGTALLCLGMGICSYAVERNSVEVEWTAGETADAGSLPRLLFLQQEHSVNDQYFEAYTLLSGRKSRILGSARNPNSYSTKLVNTTWEWITVAGAVASGVGFTCQFMGLRGLTYPCSLAQLGAVVLMVILRGFIRRGLGRESAHSPMLSRYELEHLAILITYLPEFRSFDEPKRENQEGVEAQPLQEVFGWKVTLPRSRAHGLTTKKSTNDTDTNDTESHHNTKSFANPRLYIPSPSSFQPASSEQLLRVRRRLGNLCQWKSRSAEHALILTRSIEHFMDVFFPLENLGSLPSVKTWEVPVSGPMGEDKITFMITAEERHNKRKWRIDIGKVEAAMSLWMAFKEAKMQPPTAGSRPPRSTVASAKNESDWLRNEDGTGRQKFYRLLGESTMRDPVRPAVADDLGFDSDNSKSEISDSDSSDSDSSDSDDSDQPAPRLSVLERNIKWWVGDQFTLISRPTRDYQKGGKDPAEFDPWLLQGHHAIEIPELVTGFNGSFDTDEGEGEHDAPQDNGSNNNNMPHGKRHELGVISEGYLADILTQHLFTSFIWAISKSLPEDCLKVGFQTGNQDIEIENRDQFDLHQFDGTWYLPKLSHIKLREVVRQIESYGLGNKVDIMLCIIPALSERDLLPNHAMLQLIPPVSAANDWATVARCYHSLMLSTLEISKPEKLCYAVTVHVMDFLELACQPYSKSFMPAEHLLLELREIVRNLRVDHFIRVLQNIIAVLHKRQGRGTVFENIIRLYGGESNEWHGLLSLYQEGDTDIVNENLKKVVGFSSSHQKVFDRLYKEGTYTHDFRPTYKEITEQDIFGWTPLHYCSSCPEEKWNKAQMLLWSYCTKSPAVKCHHHPDRLGRTPLHIAASRGFEEGLMWMTSDLALSEERNALVLQGQDGMTPLHLAVLSQNQICLDFVIGEEDIFQTPIKDAWGREPLHIASQTRNAESVNKILGRVGWSLSQDLMGKTAIDYAVTFDEQKDPDQDADDHIASSGETESLLTSSSKSRHGILLELARIRPKWKDENGKAFIHHTAEIGDPDILCELIEDVSMAGDANMPDSDGKTPLHYAISKSKNNTALKLLEKFGVDPLVEDKDKTTPLMLAVGEGLTDVVKTILKLYSPEQLNKRDRSGNSAVHYLFSSKVDKKATEGERLEILKMLEEAGCNILQEGDKEQTILHKALYSKDEPIWTYLLSLARDRFKDLSRPSKSVLIEACQSGSSPAVSLFLELWPDAVRDVDAFWGRSPLSWACAKGHEDIIRILAANPETDLNYSSDSYGRTPLHLAADRRSPNALACLLEHDASRHDLSVTDKSGRTPVALAVERRRVQTIKMLLDHPQTSDEEKIKYFQILLDSDGKTAHKFHDTIVWLFRTIPENVFINDGLLFLIHSARNLRLWEALNIFVQRAMKTDLWTELEYPYHVGIETCNAKLIAYAIDKGLSFQDKDGWSLQDYAASRGCADILSALDLSVLPRLSTDVERRPENLVWGRARQYQKISRCRSHGKIPCPGIQDEQRSIAEVAHIGPGPVCRRIAACPIPLTADISTSKSVFAQILHQGDSLLALGFCSEAKEVRGMPGSLHQSWGFYGDSGHLLARGAPTGEDKSIDLGYVQSFGAGDIVGVGWSSVTGEALCTRNGERLRLEDDMQETIKRMMLNTGKKYACIGHPMRDAGVGLQFRINFGISPHHPFMYEGPFF